MIRNGVTLVRQVKAMREACEEVNGYVPSIGECLAMLKALEEAAS